MISIAELARALDAEAEGDASLTVRAGAEPAVAGPDEIALAIFLVGGDPTFPVFLYGQLRFAQRLPVLIAGAVLLMLGTVALTLLITRLQARRAD